VKLIIQVCFTVTLLMFLGISAKAGVADPTLFGIARCGADTDSTLYTIDTSTGVATPIGLIGFDRCGGMDFDSNGTLFATCNRLGETIGVLITIDLNTGAGTEVGTLCASTNASSTDISFRNADDVLFGLVFSTAGGCLEGYNTINTLTGAGTGIGSPSTNCCGLATGFSSNDTLFLADGEVAGNPEFCSTAPSDLYTVDQSNGNTTDIADINYPADPFDFCPRPNAMDFHPITDVLFASVVNGDRRAVGGDNRSWHLANINTTTGDVSNNNPTVDCLDAIAFEPVVEPPSGPIVIIPTIGQWGMIFATVLLGIFAIIALRRRTES